MANTEARLEDAIREVVARDLGQTVGIENIVNWIYNGAYFWDVRYIEKSPPFRPLKHSAAFRDKKYGNLWNAVNDFIAADPDVLRLKISDPRELASYIFEFVVYWQDIYWKEKAEWSAEFAQETENEQWAVDATGYYEDTGAENAGS